MINVDVKKRPVMSKYDIRVCNICVSVVRIKVRIPLLSVYLKNDFKVEPMGEGTLHDSYRK